MFGIENNMKNKVIKRTLKIEEEEEFGLQFVPFSSSSKSSPRCSQDGSKGGRTAARWCDGGGWFMACI